MTLPRLVLRCPVHPSYKGKQRPRRGTDCDSCDRLYGIVHELLQLPMTEKSMQAVARRQDQEAMA